jgi:hypothetical protein
VTDNDGATADDSVTITVPGTVTVPGVSGGTREGRGTYPSRCPSPLVGQG